MGKTKKDKKFSGATVRTNPTGLAIYSEQDFENGDEDIWQRISQQLESSKLVKSAVTLICECIQDDFIVSNL